MRRRRETLRRSPSRLRRRRDTSDDLRRRRGGASTPTPQALAPCGPRAARFLLASLEGGCSAEALDAAAVLATGRHPRRTTRVTEEMTRLFRDDLVDLNGDIPTYVRALRAFGEAPHPEQYCTERGLDSAALRAAARARPALEKWLEDVAARAVTKHNVAFKMHFCPSPDWPEWLVTAQVAAEDSIQMASCGEDPDPLRKALCAGFFARAARFAPDACYRTLRADREITLHSLSVHAAFGTPPEYVCFADFGRDDTGGAVARHASRVDPRWLLDAAGEYYRLK